MFVFCFTSAHAAAINVNTTLTVMQNDGLCSIAEAITAANLDQQVDGCIAGNGEDIILLENQNYVLVEADNMTDGPNGLPVIQSSITIQGIGRQSFSTSISRHSPVVADPQDSLSDPNPSMRIFRVGDQGNLLLKDLRILGGFVGSSSPTNSLNNHGGAILSTGLLVLQHVFIASNRVTGSGGGIYFTGQLEISDNSVFANNRAISSGGGIAGTGRLIVQRSLMRGNGAESGGAIHIHTGQQAHSLVSVINSYFVQNGATQGGAIAVDATIELKLLHTTIDGNTASSAGGGLFIKENDSATLPPENSIIGNSIIARNNGGDCHLSAETVVNMMQNRFSDDTCDGQASGDPGIIEPSLLPNTSVFFSTPSENFFVENIRTKVIDAGDDLICDNPLVGNLDLLGGFRKFDGNRFLGIHCDIGAIEFHPSLDNIKTFAFLQQFDLHSQWKQSKIDHTQPDQFAELIFSSPPTTNGIQPGVVRFQSIDGCCTEDFVRSASPPPPLDTQWKMRFQEYTYLDQFHVTEHVSILGAQHRIIRSNNGESVIVGSFKLSGTGQWKTIDFPRVDNVPAVFLTVQTANGDQPVSVRVRNVTRNSFEAALFEEERLMLSGHLMEEVAYLLIDSPSQRGLLDIAGNLLPYQLEQTSVDHRWTPVFDVELKLEEEQSVDPELWHVKETVDVLQIDGHIFAQLVTNHGGDTTSLRLR
jgi:predicted outer membrane repeat protein